MSDLPPEPPSREITPESTYLGRREFLKQSALFIGTAGLIGGGLLQLLPGGSLAKKKPKGEEGALASTPNPLFDTTEERTPLRSVSTYNNFYEFGTDKAEPAENAHTLRTRPWTVEFDGEIASPGRYDIDTVMGWSPLEERVYRMRCVEAWSMVVPWIGLPLGAVIRRLGPTSRAKYVAFRTLHDPEQMPWQRKSILPWPYVEALRIDEALHPLTLLAVGLYGKVLPKQNGAPIRLVVPWKYGFKGIKSIVRVSFVEQRPPNTWNAIAPDEYGFYANVNPAVDHPRWSQASERRIGELSRRPTLPFNGYAEQVAGLYAGLDLRENF